MEERLEMESARERVEEKLCERERAEERQRMEESERERRQKVGETNSGREYVHDTPFSKRMLLLARLKIA